MERETNDQINTRLMRELPMYSEAKRIVGRMMRAGDDGTWAGELDPVRVHIYQTAVLAEELAKLVS